MSQIIDVPGMGELEFPDSMDDNAIRDVLRRHKAAAAGPGPAAQPSEGPSSAANGAGNTNPATQPARAPTGFKMGGKTYAQVGQQLDMPMWKRAGLGAATAIDDITQSVRQLLPGTDKKAAEDDVQFNRDLRASSGTAGKVAHGVTDAAIMMAPGAAVESGALKMLPKAVEKLPVLTKMASAALSGGALEGLLRPTVGDESRVKNAATGAASSAALSGVVQGGLRLAKGAFKPNAEGAYLLQQGITPPLEAATDSGAGKALGRTTETMLNLTGMGGQAEKRLDQGVLREALKRSTPQGYVPPGADAGTRTITNQLATNSDAAYAAALGGQKVGVDKASMRSFERQLTRVPGKADDKTIAIETLLENFRTNSPTNAETFQRSLHSFSKDAARMATSPDPSTAKVGAEMIKVAERIKQLRDAQLPPDKVAQLADADSAWRSGLRVRVAAAAPGSESGIKTKALATAVRQLDNTHLKDDYGLGHEPLQDLTDHALTAMDRSGGAKLIKEHPFATRVPAGVAGLTGLLINPALTFATAVPALGASRAVQSEAGTKALLGQYEKQKMLAEFLRRNPNLPTGSPLYELLGGGGNNDAP